MLGVIDPYRLPYTLAASLLVILVGALILRRYKRTKRLSILDTLSFLFSLALLVALAIPGTNRLSRAYVDGKDQFEWAAILESGDRNLRQRAIVALCQMLREMPNEVPVRTVALNALVRSHATEAIPELQNIQALGSGYICQELEKTIQELSSAARINAGK
jgi:hypothetical protein